jgi:predicted MPP superfamily phosphohydrolase
MSRFNLSVFLLVMTLVLCAGFAFLDWSLLRRLAKNRSQRNAFRIALGSMLGLQFVIQPLYRGAAVYTWSGITWMVGWAAFTGLGLAAFLFFFSVVSDVIRAGAWLGLKAKGKRPEQLPDPARRLFFGRQLPATIIGASGLGTLAGLASARIIPQVETVEIPIPKLPPDLDGFSFCQISDLHIGPTIGASFVEDVVAEANAAQADAILLTGDIVDGHVPQIRSVSEKLGLLKAQHGTFFIPGNHEYFWNAEEWIAEYTRLGIIPLINQHHVIQKGSAKIALGGLPDVVGPRFISSHVMDVPRTFSNAPDGALRVLLAHNPKPVILDEAVRAGVALQISGHTHAGQFYPFAFFVGIAHKYISGRYTHTCPDGQCELYVNRGTGYWGPPIRLGIRPEITKIVLRSQA